MVRIRHHLPRFLPRSLRSIAILLCLLALAPPAARGADPFYANLLREGALDYGRGDYAAAAHTLRIACFGFLDEPDLLAEGLIRLGLAQAGLEDQRGFTSTFRRLLEIEDLFGAYTSAPVPASLKATFESELARRIDPRELRASTLFSDLAAQRQVSEQSQIPAKKQRSQLKKALKKDPENLQLLWELAQLEMSEDQPREAGPLFDRILELDPADPDARCLRGQARLRIDDCERAAPDLEACSYEASDVQLIRDHLGCLEQLEDWRQASLLLRRLPESLQADPDIVLISNQIREVEGQLALPPADLTSAAVPGRVELVGDVRRRFDDDSTGHGDVLADGLEHCEDRDVVVAFVPAVVVGGEGERRVADLRLPGELGLRQVRHADDRRAPRPIEERLGAGRERGPFHAHVGAALVHGGPGGLRRAQ